MFLPRWDSKPRKSGRTFMSGIGLLCLLSLVFNAGCSGSLKNKRAAKVTRASKITASEFSDIKSAANKELTGEININVTSGKCVDLILGSSDNAGLVASVAISGMAPNCTYTVAYVPNQTGSSKISFLDAKDPTLLIGSFTNTVVPIEDLEPQAPTISNVSDQSIDEDNPLTGISVIISDRDSNLTCDSLIATSSNVALVPSSSLTISGTVPNCLLSLTSSLNQSGTASISLSVTDGSLVATDTFLVTVSAANDAPTISNLPDQVTSEDTALNNIAVAIGDIDSSLSCAASLTATSADMALVPSLVVSGTAPNCLLSLTPGLNLSGSSLITLSVSDGTLSTEDTFILTVSAVNDAPSLSSVSNQTTYTDVPVTALALTIQDIDSSLTCASSVSKSSSDTVLLPAGNIVISGTSPNCLVSLTPASGLQGQSTVTLAVSDTSLTASSSFTFKVIKGWYQEAYIKASNPDAGDKFGSSLDIDGNTIAVGAIEEGSNQITITNGTDSSTANSALKSGAVYVYKRAADTWSQEAYIKASNADAGDYFGRDVSLSKDTIVVGSEMEASNNTAITNGTASSTDNSMAGAGAAYVFKRSSATWAQTAFLKAGNSQAGDLFGSSVAISGNGILVGAPEEDSNQQTIDSYISGDDSASNAGAVYGFYNRGTGPEWYFGAYYKSSNVTPGFKLGNALAISGDTTVAASSYDQSNETTITNGQTSSTDSSLSQAGAVYVFKGSSQEAYIKPSNVNSGDLFGRAVSLSGDTLVVGATGESSNQTTITNGTGTSANNSLSSSGAVYIYRRTGSNWAQEAYLKASNAGSADLYGISVDVSGNTLIVGATGESSNETTVTNGTNSSTNDALGSSGASYIYVRSGATWVSEAYLKSSNSRTNYLAGGAVRVSGDTVIVGSAGESSNQATISNGSTSSGNSSLANAGAVYIYRNKDRLFVPQPVYSATGYFSIEISWGANLGTSNQVKITKSKVTDGAPPECSDPSAVTVAPGLTSYEFTGLSSNTAYDFKVCAVDGTTIGEAYFLRGAYTDSEPG